MSKYLQVAAVVWMSTRQLGMYDGEEMIAVLEPGGTNG